MKLQLPTDTFSPFGVTNVKKRFPNTYVNVKFKNHKEAVTDMEKPTTLQSILDEDLKIQLDYQLDEKELRRLLEAEG